MSHFIWLGSWNSSRLPQNDQQSPCGTRPDKLPSADQPSHRIQTGELYVLERDQDADRTDQTLLDQQCIETMYG